MSDQRQHRCTLSLHFVAQQSGAILSHVWHRHKFPNFYHHPPETTAMALHFRRWPCRNIIIHFDVVVVFERTEKKSSQTDAKGHILGNDVVVLKISLVLELTRQLRYV